MAENSKIEWTDHTFNPWMGCTRVSPGCQHCYAEALMDARYGKVQWGPQGKRVKTKEEYWRKPIQWNRNAWEECRYCGWRGVPNAASVTYLCPKCECETIPTRQRVFCASLADVFEDNQQVADWRGELFELIHHTPNLDWLILTKRTEKIFSLGTDAVGEIFDNWIGRHPNVWLGTSVESQEYLDVRLGPLLEICGTGRTFLSVEPMIGPVRLRDSNVPWKEWLDWVIVGGESGRGCRPMETSWASLLLEDCRDGGVKFFMKQLGGHPDKRDNLEDFPQPLRVREWPV